MGATPVGLLFFLVVFTKSMWWHSTQYRYYEDNNETMIILYSYEQVICYSQMLRNHRNDNCGDDTNRYALWDSSVASSAACSPFRRVFSFAKLPDRGLFSFDLILTLRLVSFRTAFLHLSFSHSRYLNFPLVLANFFPDQTSKKFQRTWNNLDRVHFPESVFYMMQ